MMQRAAIAAATTTASTSSSSPAKNGVKALSIIDTISELAAQGRSEADVLAFNLSTPPVPPGGSRGLAPPPPPPLTQPASIRQMSSGSLGGGEDSLPDFGPDMGMDASSPIRAIDHRHHLQQHPVADGRQVAGRTLPDWIVDVFEHASSGNLDQLERRLKGIEPSLVRNMADQRGNNLLHAVCSSGHPATLAWLMERFGPDVLDALASDENCRGVSPAVAAIKRGHHACFRWMVENTGVGRGTVSMAPPAGKRSLLHHAAKFGQDTIVEWILEREVSPSSLPATGTVDSLDFSGKSALHLAAEKGHVSTAAILLYRGGADVKLKSSTGFKPYDLAKMAKTGNKGCAEFLMLYEAALDMADELAQASSAQEKTLSELSELSSLYLKTVSTGRQLAMERETICKEMKQLHDSTVELHERLTRELQVLTDENASLQRQIDADERVSRRMSRLSSSRQPEGLSREESGRIQDCSSKALIEACKDLDEKWKMHHEAWSSSSSVFLNGEIKSGTSEEGCTLTILTAAVVRRSPAKEKDSKPVGNFRLLRDRVSMCRRSHDEQGRRALAAASSVGADLVLSSESDSEGSDGGWGVAPASSGATLEARRKHWLARRQKLPTPTPTAGQNELGGDGSKASSSSSSPSPLEDSLYSSLSNDIYTKILAPNNSADHPRPCTGTSSPIVRPMVLDGPFKGCSLVSESGTAAVLEVIEPTSSEEEEFQRSMRDMSWNSSSLIFPAAAAGAVGISQLISPAGGAPAEANFPAGSLLSHRAAVVERGRRTPVLANGSQTGSSSGRSSLRSFGGRAGTAAPRGEAVPPIKNMSTLDFLKEPPTVGDDPGGGGNHGASHHRSEAPPAMGGTGRRSFLQMIAGSSSKWNQGKKRNNLQQVQQQQPRARSSKDPSGLNASTPVRLVEGDSNNNEEFSFDEDEDLGMSGDGKKVDGVVVGPGVGQLGNNAEAEEVEEHILPDSFDDEEEEVEEDEDHGHVQQHRHHIHGGSGSSWGSGRAVGQGGSSPRFRTQLTTNLNQTRRKTSNNYQHRKLLAADVSNGVDHEEEPGQGHQPGSHVKAVEMQFESFASKKPAKVTNGGNKAGVEAGSAGATTQRQGAFSPETKSPNISSSSSKAKKKSVVIHNISLSSKPWYDVPSDEDPEAPEVDSLASIITHKSSSSEDEG